MSRAILLLFLCASAWAQVYEAKNCVYREGDDPAWARADYDDSAWQTTAPDAFTARRASPYIWARCRIEIPQVAAPRPLYLQINLANAWIVYVDGRKAGAFGDSETGEFTMDTMRELPVPEDATSGGDLNIAVRATQRYFALGLASWPGLAAGGRSDLELRAARWRIDRLHRALPSLVPAMVNLGLAVVLLILAVSGSNRRDALLLGLMSLSQTGVTLSQGLPIFGISVALYLAVNDVMRPLAVASPFFAHFMLGRITPRIFRHAGAVLCAYYAVLLATVFMPFSYAFTWMTWLASPVLVLFMVVLWLVIGAASVTAFFPWRRYTRVEKLMLIANTIGFGGTLFLVGAFLFDKPLIPLSNSVVLVHGVTFNLFYTMVIALRFRRVNDEHQALTYEMKSAREVQRRLVPEAPFVPGFRIDTAYVPAQEVGGDFYQLLPADDGSLLVVGDVSGKGLDAAMVVAAAVGALAHLSSRIPEDVLDHLNQSLVGKTRGGFVTCCCALFGANATVRIANAGHIPPYLQGRELELTPGPPLGIFADAEYESTTVSAGAGVITFLSDGVLEATNTQGELLGFERLAGLSAKPAGEIAKEAERWGQEDDITVVQVAYA